MEPTFPAVLHEWSVFKVCSQIPCSCRGKGPHLGSAILQACGNVLAPALRAPCVTIMRYKGFQYRVLGRCPDSPRPSSGIGSFGTGRRVLERHGDGRKRESSVYVTDRPWSTKSGATPAALSLPSVTRLANAFSNSLASVSPPIFGDRVPCFSRLAAYL